MISPSPTLTDLLTETLRRLGQGGFATPLWEHDELLGYWNEGAAELARQTEMIWDRDTLDDLPLMSNHSFHFEPDFIQSRRFRQLSGITNLDFEIHTVGDRCEYDFPWERHYSESTAGSGQMDFTWERLYAPDSSLQPSAVVPLPEGCLNVERVTWSDRRIDALHTAELERKDRVYDQATGDVIAYTQENDGYGTLRKYHIPTIASIPHALGVRGIPRGVVELDPEDDIVFDFFMHIDEWAIIIAADLDGPSSIFDGFHPGIPLPSGSIFANRDTNSWDDPSSLGFAQYTIDGTAGGLRLLPGYHPAHGYLGGARRISPSLRNTAIEFRRTSLPFFQLHDRPELPPYQLKYLRHYVCWRALKRRGPGQNLKLAEHYKSRWDAGVARVIRRLESAHSQREIVLGGAGLSPTQPPLARPPWELDYGQLDRF